MLVNIVIIGVLKISNDEHLISVHIRTDFVPNRLMACAAMVMPEFHG